VVGDCRVVYVACHCDCLCVLSLWFFMCFVIVELFMWFVII
jgi:hypothetical protein